MSSDYKLLRGMIIEARAEQKISPVIQAETGQIFGLTPIGFPAELLEEKEEKPSKIVWRQQGFTPTVAILQIAEQSDLIKDSAFQSLFLDQGDLVDHVIRNTNFSGNNLRR